MASGASKRKSQHGTSFKMYQRKEFVRDLEIPGMAYHVVLPFKLIFGNLGIFLPVFSIMVLMAVFLVGLSNEFLNGQTIIFGSLVFLMIFLVTIFAIRHRLAGNEITFRDALYNSMSPFFATLIVLLVAAIQCIPIAILAISYSAALETHFLDMPFYAFLFFVFAALLILFSLYLLSVTLTTLVAVTAPGVYPVEAFKNTSELMRGRKIKFMLRMIVLAIFVVAIWVVGMFLVVKFSEFIAQYDWATKIPFVKVFGIMMACFLAMYISVYLFVYYRWMLNMDLDLKKQK